MAVIVMLNAQMPKSCSQRSASLASNYCQIPYFSSGFLVSRRPDYGIVLNVKQAKQFRVLKTRKCQAIFALLSSETDDRTAEKNVEFMPSFDGHLKVMESIIRRREKRKDGLTKTDLSSKPENQITEFEGREKQSQVKLDGPVHEFNEKAKKQGFNRPTFGHREIVVKESVVASEVGVSKGPSGKNYAKKSTVVVQDTLGSRGSESIPEAKINVGGKMKNKTWSRYQTGSSKDMEKGKTWKVQSSHGLPGKNKNIGSRLQDSIKASGMLERKIQEEDRLLEKSYEIEKRGLQSSEIHVRHERNWARDENFTDQEVVLQKGYLSRSSRTYLDKGGGKILDMERSAFKTFDKFNDIMDKPRVTRMEMEERIQKLAKLLNGADINIPEWIFSKMMRSAKIRFTDFSILRVIQILGKLGNWRRVLQVIEWLHMRERFKSHKLRNIYTAALDVLGKSRRPVEALNLFYAMQQQLSSYPDLIAYHCIAVTLGQAGHMKELFDVIDCMRSPPKKKFKRGALEKWDPRLEPDLVIYNAVLNACVQRKQWEGAFWVLQQLKQQGQQPSSTTYGLVMEVMFTCGKYNLVHEFFRKVQKSTIPNALIYKVLVNTLWREGRIDEAVLAVKDMEKRGIVGSASLYYDLGRCLCSVGRCDEALMQIEKICKVATKPLVVTYTGLIQACLDTGNIQDGIYIFCQMLRFCSPNLVTYNIMMKGYLEHGMFEEAKQLFQDMLEDSYHIRSNPLNKERVLPDTYTFNTMLEACFADKRWGDFEYFYEQMLQHGYHFNAKRHLRMILDASRSGKEELLEKTWKHLAQTDRVQPYPLIMERFCMKLEKDGCAAAIACIIGIPDSEFQAFSEKAWLKLFEDNAQRFQTHTLVGLIHKVSIVIDRSELPNQLLQNLISSCKQFLRIHTKVADINLTETVSTVPSTTSLKM